MLKCETRKQQLHGVANPNEQYINYQNSNQLYSLLWLKMKNIDFRIANSCKTAILNFLRYKSEKQYHNCDLL